VLAIDVLDAVAGGGRQLIGADVVGLDVLDAFQLAAGSPCSTP
jgi:hypothetical protein